MKRVLRRWGFLLGVVILYIILIIITPDLALTALKRSGGVFIHLLPPLSIAFILMWLLKLFVKPVHISKFLGQKVGIKGVILSTLAGIISIGPIYAWYPLLKDLREKGTSDFHLANFLSNRAVKPFLLPLMIFYFGWKFSLIFNILLILNALLVATLVNLTTVRKWITSISIYRKQEE